MDQSRETDQPGRDGGSAAHDRIADELRLLLDAAAQRAEEYLNSRSDAAADGRSDAPASCGWCPLCTVVALLRGQRPDLRFVEQLAAVITLLRQSFAESYERPSPPDHAEDNPDSDNDTDIKVQRISVQRVNGRVLRETTAGKGHGC